MVPVVSPRPNPVSVVPGDEGLPPRSPPPSAGVLHSQGSQTSQESQASQVPESIARTGGQLLEPVPGLFCARWGSGPRVVVGLHGWSGSHATFLALLPHLPADVTLYAFDQPSFGESAPPTDWRMRTFVAPLAAALEALDLHDVTLLGSCGGAVIGLELARAANDRVTRMVMLDPFAFVPWYFALLTLPIFGRFFYLSTFANPIGRWIADLSLRARRAKDTSLTSGFRGASHHHAHEYLKLLCTLDDLSRYAPIRAHAVLLYGAKTFGAVKQSVVRFHRLWPSSQVRELDGAGHLPIEEATAAVALHAFAPQPQAERHD
jgi:pimeloyl-ACP methyl ester carboxylesterase